MNFIDINTYIVIGTLITIIALISFIMEDWEQLDIFILISDITNASMIGAGWIVTIPILCIGNITIALLYIIAGLKVSNDKRDDDE